MNASELNEVEVSVGFGQVRVAIRTSPDRTKVEDALARGIQILKENVDSIRKANESIQTSFGEGASPGGEPLRVIGRNIDAILPHLDDLPVGILALLVLGDHERITRLQMKSTIEDWGKPVGSWFDGGNFNRDLVRKGLVKVVGTDKTGEKIYGLTEKGRIKAQEFIVKFNAIGKNSS